MLFRASSSRGGIDRPARLSLLLADFPLMLSPLAAAAVSLSLLAGALNSRLRCAFLFCVYCLLLLRTPNQLFCRRTSSYVWLETRRSSGYRDQINSGLWPSGVVVMLCSLTPWFAMMVRQTGFVAGPRRRLFITRGTATAVMYGDLIVLIMLSGVLSSRNDMLSGVLSCPMTC